MNKVCYEGFYKGMSDVLAKIFFILHRNGLLSCKC
jgi:hypothetical protein